MAHDQGTTMRQRFGVDTVDIDGFPVLNVDQAGFVDIVVSEAKQGRGGWVVTPNSDILQHARRSPEIRALLQKADALVADGMPLVWASMLQGTPLRGGRVCGSDLIYSIPAAAAKAGLGVFLLGGAGDTGERTRDRLVELNPGLRIVGTYSPPFGFEKRPEEYDAMLAALREAKPDIVFVALSFPKGERLIQVIRQAAPNAWYLGVGAAFDFVSGQIKRAPKLMQNTGTEWVFRMTQDPDRLIRRYLVDDLPYVLRMLAGAARRRVQGT